MKIGGRRLIGWRSVWRVIACRLMGETRGAEIAETAAVLPLMFMILLGIFWFGQAFSIYGAISRAAQEGARAGSVGMCATCGPPNTQTQYDNNAATAVENTLQASQLSYLQARYPQPRTDLTSCVNGTVKCEAGGNANICIQAPIQLTTSGPGATGLCGISVTFQYPFQFWLPFTSLNKQVVWISASSRMRLETQ
jgi:Flp pilus assembly protein TadG